MFSLAELFFFHDSVHADATYNFRAITNSSITKYALVLHRFIFNCLRFYVDPETHWESSFQYPTLSRSQVDVLKALAAALQDSQSDNERLMVHFERAVQCLFCHLKTEYPETASGSRFFSPICSFVVLHCLNKEGRIQPASNVTQLIAALMYCGRAAVLWHVVRQQEADPSKSLLDLARAQDVYLKDQQETPMAFMFNALKVLTQIRDNEGHESQFHWVSDCELSHHGDIISFANIKNAVEGLEKEYIQHMHNDLMFGRPIPPDFHLNVDISTLVEDESSRVVGYSFLNDPRNNLSQYKDKFGRFVMSDPVLRERFVHLAGGRVVWKADACEAWLRSFEESLLLLATGLVLSAGPSARATEIARYVLREMPGVPRNVGLVARNVSLNSTQDKTSHRRLLDHFVPHISTPAWQKLLLHHLCVVRPFADFLVGQLFAPDSPEVKRFDHYLWPGLNGNMDSGNLSDSMGYWTEKFIGTPIKSQKWRSLVTVIFRHHAHPQSAKVQEDCYYDQANMHSTATADTYYSGNTDLPAGSSLKDLLGYVEVSEIWHRLMRLDEHGRISPAAVARLLPSVAPPSGGQFLFVYFSCKKLTRILAP